MWSQDVRIERIVHIICSCRIVLIDTATRPRTNLFHHSPVSIHIFNTTNTMEDWRRIDIDALETDKFLTKEELIPQIANPVDDSTIPAIINDCKSKLTKGQFLECLQLALDNPPYLSPESVKNTYNDLMFEVLCSIKSNNSDLKPFITKLSSDQQDTLVKYLYKIMSTPTGSKQGGTMLVWFEKTIEITGLGPIIRYMNDRRTV